MGDRIGSVQKEKREGKGLRKMHEEARMEMMRVKMGGYERREEEAVRAPK